MAPWSSAGSVTVRLLTYLEGKTLSAAPRTLTQTQSLGALLARLGVALKGFQHVADRRDLAWDLAHMARLQPLLDAVPDGPLGHVLKIRPPLPFSRANADEFLGKLGEALHELSQET